MPINELTEEQLTEWLTTIYDEQSKKKPDGKIVLGYGCKNLGVRLMDTSAPFHSPCNGCDCEFWKRLEDIMVEDTKDFLTEE